MTETREARDSREAYSEADEALYHYLAQGGEYREETNQAA